MDISKAHLDEKGLSIYNKSIKDLKDSGLYVPGYRVMIGNYAFSLQMADRIREAIKKEGFTVKHTNKKGFTNDIPNPKIKVYRELTTMALGIARQFGFTPASRAKLNIPKKKKRAAFDLI